MYKGFLSDEECDHLVTLVNPTLFTCLIETIPWSDTSLLKTFLWAWAQAQGKLGNASEVGTGSADPICTGSLMFLDRGQVS